MTVPTIFATDFRRVTLSGVADVQDIIDEIVDEITLNLPAASRWTAEGGGKYQSPPDAAGRVMHVTLTRISATRFQFFVEDQDDQTVHDGTNDISAPATATIWSGPHHLVVEVSNGGAFEVGRAFMVDPAPMALTAHNTFVYGLSRRNSAGTGITGGNEAHWFGADDTGGVIGRAAALRVRDGFNPALTYQTLGGSDLVVPVFISSESSANNYDLAGRAFQAIMVDGSEATGNVVSVPIDTATTGDFEVLSLVDDGIGNLKLGVRMA